MKITDAQIRKLARRALTAAQHRDCEVALGVRREFLVIEGRGLAIWRPTASERRAARRRCAKISA